MKKFFIFNFRSAFSRSFALRFHPNWLNYVTFIQWANYSVQWKLTRSAWKLKICWFIYSWQLEPCCIWCMLYSIHDVCFNFAVFCSVFFQSICSVGKFTFCNLPFVGIVSSGPSVVSRHLFRSGMAPSSQQKQKVQSARPAHWPSLFTCVQIQICTFYIADNRM